jgi:death on curing protein
MAGSCSLLTIDEIIDINAQMLIMAGEADNFIGEDNLRYPDALHYIMEAVQSVMFGVDQYPTVIDKASAVGWQISASHVFWEGNKRTGMEVCRQILEMNGYYVNYRPLKGAACP